MSTQVGALVRRRVVKFGVLLASSALFGCGSTPSEKAARSTTQALVACGAAPAWAAGVAYAAGTRVKNHEVLYECRGAPFSAWCGKPQYEPGVSAYFRDAWLRVDKCIPTAGPVSAQVSGNCGSNAAACCPAGYSVLSLSEGSDVVQAVTTNQCILARGSADTIAAYGGQRVVFGGAGNDTIHAANGDNVVVPGPGIDTVALGTGNDTAIIFDLCEVESGDQIDFGSGQDTLITPVPLAQLQALGVTIAHVDTVIVQQNSCKSECVSAPSCSGHGTCVEGGQAGQVRCDCEEPFAGPNCETRRVDAVQRWSVPSAASGPLGIGAFDAQGGILTDSLQAIVSVSPQGQATTLASGEARRFAIDRTATRFAVHTPTAFEAYTRAGVLQSSVARRVNEFGSFVPGGSLTYLPEIPDLFEKPVTTHARFYSGTTLLNRFAVPGLRISRVTATGLVYATGTELLNVSQQGSVSWRRNLRLVTFEVSDNGSKLIGLVEGTPPAVVHVDLANGTVSPQAALDSAFWNIAISVNGRYSVATTKTALYAFDQGALLRRVDLPVQWLVSANVADDGSIVLGAQIASHAGSVFLLGGNGSGASNLARPVDSDAFRPYVRFFPGNQQFLSNEASGLIAFAVRP